MGYLYGEWGGGGRGESGHEILYLSERLGRVGGVEGSCCYQAMSKLIIAEPYVDDNI